MAFDLNSLGPLKHLAGIWEGNSGDDIAPADDRGIENNKYRERTIFEPFGPVNNHEQELYGLKYSTMAWRLGEADSFHEETGYWLWDPKEKQVLRCFIVPRGVTVLAGGTVQPGATLFELSAKVGSSTYGICSNLFLDREFKTVEYVLKMTVQPGVSFTYEEDTILKIKGQEKLFHHIDRNILKKLT